jgi:hypothetical protein
MFSVSSSTLATDGLGSGLSHQSLEILGLIEKENITVYTYSIFLGFGKKKFSEN